MNTRTTLTLLLLMLLTTACAGTDPCAGVVARKKSDLDWVLPMQSQDDPPRLLNASASTLVYRSAIDPSKDLGDDLFRLSTSGGSPTALSLPPVYLLAREADTIVGSVAPDSDGNTDTKDLAFKLVSSSDAPVTAFATYTLNSTTDAMPAAVLPDSDQLLLAAPNQQTSPTSLLLTRLAQGGARSMVPGVPLKGQPLVFEDSSSKLARVGENFFAEALVPSPTQSQTFRDSYSEVQLMSFPASGGSSNVVAVDAPLVKLVGATDSDLLVGTLKPEDAALKRVNVRFWRLPGGVGPGTEITLEGGRRAEDLDPVWAAPWAGAPGNAFSPSDRVLYFLPKGASEARLVACLDQEIRVTSLVGAGSKLFAAIEGNLEAGIARFSLP